jgi:hypothetical protein
LTTDQRGLSLPYDINCDVGAFELGHPCDEFLIRGVVCCGPNSTCDSDGDEGNQGAYRNFPSLRETLTPAFFRMRLGLDRGVLNFDARVGLRGGR